VIARNCRFLFILPLVLVSCSFGQDRPVVGPPPQRVAVEYVPQPQGIRVESWVRGLEVPWSLVFLRDERAIVSERPGRIRLIERDGTLQEQPIATLEVDHTAEAGLLGIAVHPQFPEQPFVYAMHTYRDGRQRLNRVVRLRWAGEGEAEIDRVIIDKIPGHTVHNGGGLLFGDDGMLYITTGDIWQAELAQDLESLAGKILRLTPDGQIPQDNPFANSPVWSLGHRNPQGLALHPQTRDLFSSEHGPSGEYGLRGMDIINVIVRGGNYGWPRVWGDANVEGYIDPIVMWERAVPPGGIAFRGDDLFVATMRSQALVRIALQTRDDGSYDVTGIQHWFARDATSGQYGRLRDVVLGPDNAIYFTTSNRDGRGRPQSGDDQIFRITWEGDGITDAPK
jgi:glucose/arabinose dehydrogenase